jgi:hypothetical protein
MDEADYLGDRIAIMAKGKVQCCGSSLFLKSKYGVGYTFTISKTPSCNSDNLTRLVTRHVPKVEPLSNAGTEISYRLPMDGADGFPPMFDELDQNGKTLGVASYGISVTTLEEVFLRVGHVHEEEEKKAYHNDHQADAAASYPIIEEKKGAPTVIDVAAKDGGSLYKSHPPSSVTPHDSCITRLLIIVVTVLSPNSCIINKTMVAFNARSQGLIMANRLSCCIFVTWYTTSFVSRVNWQHTKLTCSYVVTIGLGLLKLAAQSNSEPSLDMTVKQYNSPMPYSIGVPQSLSSDIVTNFTSGITSMWSLKTDTAQYTNVTQLAKHLLDTYWT